MWQCTMLRLSLNKRVEKTNKFLISGLTRDREFTLMRQTLLKVNWISMPQEKQILKRL